MSSSTIDAVVYIVSGRASVERDAERIARSMAAAATSDARRSAAAAGARVTEIPSAGEEPTATMRAAAGADGGARGKARGDGVRHAGTKEHAGSGTAIGGDVGPASSSFQTGAAGEFQPQVGAKSEQAAGTSQQQQPTAAVSSLIEELD